MEVTRDRWTRPVAAMHWATFVLVVAIMSAGFLMVGMDPTDPMRRNLGRLHTIAGNLLGLLTLARLVVQRRTTHPEPLPVTKLHQNGVAVVHALLYVVTLAVIATGLGTALRTNWHEYLKGDLAKPPSFESFTSRRGHEVLAIVLALLVGAHVVGAVAQQLKGGRTLRRMVPFLR